MLTFDAFKFRFPEFSSVVEPRFDLFRSDAELMMGTNESRWCSYYNVAMANLIAHFLTLNEAQASGDSNASAPLKRTDVDEVLVEYGLPSSTTSPQNGIDSDLFSTSYGQAYCRWRRMAFGGPRAIV